MKMLRLTDLISREKLSEQILSEKLVKMLGGSGFLVGDNIDFAKQLSKVKFYQS